MLGRSAFVVYAAGMGQPATAVSFGFLSAPLFAAPLQVQQHQWIYFALQKGEGWVHLVTMPASVPIEAIDQVVLLSINTHAITALDRGLFNRTTGEYEMFVRVFSE